jgi:hypothetical protein
MSVGKSTNHVVLEETIIGYVFKLEIEACVPIKMGCKPVVHFIVEEMAQEPCEGYCEHS